ncbi:endonuclease/exonuclease/phosphatase family protein [Dehalogenimonas sp. 4OHTPN]|uniref:Endonuclease/exonuclease/phosphatase family protein n=1 Tax=Dehalogenimonas sp. 4OHTPN TaxID=3166643 RepID=A0AAU8GAU0_9CHLR
MRRDEILAKLNVRLPEAVSAIALPALAVTLGLQCIRVLISGLTWVLGDRFQLGAFQLGVIAFTVFGVAFLASLLRRKLGYRRVVAASLISLSASVIFVQVWPGDPVFGLIAAGAGTAAFTLFLPVYLDEVRRQENAAIPLFAAGFLCGLVVDSLLSGTWGTYDPIWQQSAVPVLLTAAQVAALMFATAKVLGKIPISPPGPIRSRSGAWIIVGPFLFLQLLILQNIPSQSTLTGLSTATTYLWLIGAELAGIIGAFFLHTRHADATYLATLFSSGLLVTFAFFPFSTGVMGLALLFLAQVSACYLFFTVVLGMNNLQRGHTMNLSTANGVGMLLLAILILAYYAVYQIALPYENSMLVMVSAVLVSGGALTSLRYSKTRLRVNRKQWAVALLACVVALVPPAIYASTETQPAVPSDEGFPVQVLSYNLHNGFNYIGKLELEALALEIERSGADIVALQEISRGWLVNGRVDMLTWLAERLQMDYFFGPTTGAFWGNALFSRYPIISAQNHQLPSDGLPLQRGFISAKISVGGEHLQVIATHLHHVEEDAETRIGQLLALMAFFNPAERTIIMGDLNAEPSSTEIGLLRGLGIKDVIATIEPPPAYTFSAQDPFQRIDYIWVTPDITFSEPAILTSTASDHFGVMVTITK